MSETAAYQFDVFACDILKAARVLICCDKQEHFSIIVTTNKIAFTCISTCKI